MSNAPIYEPPAVASNARVWYVVPSNYGAARIIGPLPVDMVTKHHIIVSIPKTRAGTGESYKDSTKFRIKSGDQLIDGDRWRRAPYLITDPDHAAAMKSAMDLQKARDRDVALLREVDAVLSSLNINQVAALADAVRPVFDRIKKERAEAEACK